MFFFVADKAMVFQADSQLQVASWSRREQISLPCRPGAKNWSPPERCLP